MIVTGYEDDLHIIYLLRGDKVLIFVPSDDKSELFPPSDLSSLPDGLSTACPTRMALNIFLIYNIY